MYSYDQNKLKEIFYSLLERSIPVESLSRILESCSKISEGNKQVFFTSFTAAPRVTGKSPLQVTQSEEETIKQIRKDFTVSNYTVDRLARLFILLHLPAEDKEVYVNTINQIFPAAEMNELVALYSGLPLLAHPELWIFRCTEGIRSNIGGVLEAVICNNPYPAENLDEPAWNQLVMKAFFTEKPVNEIIGLEERANQKLADILTDFAHERWAAGRPVPILLWRLVGPFISEKNIEDIKRLAKQGSEEEKQAATDACRRSNFPPAKALLEELGSSESRLS